ncbi:hypothetical protein GCM10008955_33840 [Deinococcus malanensis]|uniref:Uncharacterized protein n=1 Tax=Deinococcus malanensis TaxID=1706855 RepID=A0ABQ2F379_9DEIO|nr:hypothetical protein [Deinococcus malanensis]GGK37167.1 hypothetical protein GCM10008955_33840 [Deinococcus malanensis]
MRALLPLILLTMTVPALATPLLSAPLVPTPMVFKHANDTLYSARVMLPKGLVPDPTSFDMGNPVGFKSTVLGMVMQFKLHYNPVIVITNASVKRRAAGRTTAEVHTFPTGSVTIYTSTPAPEAGGHVTCKVDLDPARVPARQMAAAVDRAVNTCTSLQILGKR